MKLLAARDGRLWIGTRTGLVSWKDKRLVRYPEIPEQPVVALAEDGEGTLWVGTWTSPAGRLCAIRSGSRAVLRPGRQFGWGVVSLFEENGNLWAGTGSGLWRWKPGPPKRYGDPDPGTLFTAFSQSEDGRLLMGTTYGLKHFAGERIEAAPVAIRGGCPMSAGCCGIATAACGSAPTVAGSCTYTKEGPMSSPERMASRRIRINDLFEDREGNIWVATTGGMDRFRDFAVSTMSSKQGLAGDFVTAVLASRDGSVWMSGSGLSRWSNGQVAIYGKRDGLPDACAAGLVRR